MWSFYTCVVVLVSAALAFGLDAASVDARVAADFALTELQKLSDSGVYNTLTLHSVVAASHESGIFHDNTLLTLQLASPHFQSKQKWETFEVIIMTHKDDGVRSFAIDEFPVMDEDAIESFWVDKMERKKVEREDTFRRLEIQALLHKQNDGLLAGDAITSQADLDAIDSADLRELLTQIDTPDAAIARRARSLDVQRRVVAPFADQEEALSSLGLADLYTISTSTDKLEEEGEEEVHTAYQRQRAKQLLDEDMAAFHA